MTFTAGNLFPSQSCIGWPESSPHLDSNPGHQIERQTTYQLIYPSPFNTWFILSFSMVLSSFLLIRVLALWCSVLACVVGAGESQSHYISTVCGSKHGDQTCLCILMLVKNSLFYTNVFSITMCTFLYHIIHDDISRFKSIFRGNTVMSVVAPFLILVAHSILDTKTLSMQIPIHWLAVLLVNTPLVHMFTTSSDLRCLHLFSLFFTLLFRPFSWNLFVLNIFIHSHNKLKLLTGSWLAKKMTI